MIRKSFCDFFRNFKYFFTACGVIYLVFIIIIASLVGFSFQLVKALSADAVEEIGQHGCRTRHRSVVYA